MSRGENILADSTEPDPPSSPQAEVLLVDDVDELRTLYATLLENQGPFEVVAEAADGRSGIEAAEEHQPDLVLLDLSMPDMDGLEALPEIRETSPESSVVVLSGFLDQRVGEQARQLGAADFIEKGTDGDEMVRRAAEAADVEVEAPAGDEVPGTPDPHKTSDPASETQELEMLARGIRHDLQEPLRIVQSYLDLLQGRFADKLPPDAQEFIGHAQEGSERMQTMIDALGEYGIVHRNVEVESMVDLDDVLDDVVENLDKRLEESPLTLTRDHLPTVRGDRGNLMRVLQNFVSNALDYCEKGRIHVTAAEDDDEWVVSVADDGPGIPEDEQDEVFSPLRRGSSAHAADGTGMGLAICRRIVEGHGGEVGVDSTPGEGSTFWFTLPKDPSAGGHDRDG